MILFILHDIETHTRQFRKLQKLQHLRHYRILDACLICEIDNWIFKYTARQLCYWPLINQLTLQNMIWLLMNAVLLLCGIGIKCHRYMTPQVQTFKQLLLLGGKFCRASSSLLFFSIQLINSCSLYWLCVLHGKERKTTQLLDEKHD